MLLLDAPVRGRLSRSTSTSNMLPFFSPYGQMYDREPVIILKELSQILKIVQLEYAINRNRRTIYHKHVLQLTLYIQEIFCHGLKRNESLHFIKKMVMSKSNRGSTSAPSHVSTLPGNSQQLRKHDHTYESKFGTSLWDVVQNITYQDGIKKITNLSNVKTGAGQGMAWIRLALNEGTLEDYVRILTNDRKLLNVYYDEKALLKDMENALVFESFLIGIRCMAFA